jgi:ABC-type molybdenum transport system ATPase subunit/photorepair protein PhrA
MGGGVSKHNVVVIGLDGAGKSTLVEALSPGKSKSKTAIIFPTADGLRYAEAEWAEQVRDAAAISIAFREDFFPSHSCGKFGTYLAKQNSGRCGQHTWVCAGP